MWKTNELGRASFQQGALQLNIDARGGNFGIHATLSSSKTHSTIKDLRAEARFQSVGNDVLPTADDQFVRGDEWHVHLPQSSGSYSLDIVFRPVILDQTAHTSAPLILEATLAVHTSLLDTHPTIDLCIDTERISQLDEAGKPLAEQADVRRSKSLAGCAAITRGASSSVLLGRHDYPFTTDLSNSGNITLRLFGEFLEKGVIRKARPWIVLGDMTQRQIVELWAAFSDTPLPLNA
jgi:hypothetical protein